jgi:hypothetical protein
LAALTILKQYACFLFAMPEGKLETLNLNDYISHLYNHFSKIIVQHLYDFSISIINKIVIVEAKYPVITGFFNQSVGIMQK